MQKRNIYFDKKLYPLSYHLSLSVCHVTHICGGQRTSWGILGAICHLVWAKVFAVQSCLPQTVWSSSLWGFHLSLIQLQERQTLLHYSDTHYCVRFYVGSRQPNPGPHSQMVISPLRLSFRYGFSEAWKANTPLNIQETSSHWQLLQRTIAQSEQEIHFAFWYGCKFYYGLATILESEKASQEQDSERQKCLVG